MTPVRDAAYDGYPFGWGWGIGAATINKQKVPFTVRLVDDSDW
jgi:hypothetical protein